MSDYILILTTTKEIEEAERIGGLLVEQRKAACVNIIVSRVYSIFFWKGNIEKQGEVQLFIKTKIGLLDEVISIIKSNHSYEVPEIIAIPILGGYKEYLNWIDESVEGEKEKGISKVI